MHAPPGTSGERSAHRVALRRSEFTGEAAGHHNVASRRQRRLASGVERGYPGEEPRCPDEPTPRTAAADPVRPSRKRLGIHSLGAFFAFPGKRRVKAMRPIPRFDPERVRTLPVEGMPVRLRNEPGCNRAHHAQGLCQRAYLRAQYHHQKQVG